MHLGLSESQTLLRDTVARMLAEKSTPRRVRTAQGTSGFDRALWDTSVGLGLLSMRGEGAASLMDAALVAEEAGRYLASIPVVEAIVASALLQRVGAAAALLQRVTSGAVVTLALAPAVPGAPQVVAGAAVASIVIFFCNGQLIAFERADQADSAPAFAATLVGSIDLCAAHGTRTLLAAGDLARDLFCAALEEWKLLSAAWLAGAARRALELAGNYSSERIQFGRPIGSFQGVAHPLANSVTDTEGARLMVQRAIWAIAAQRADAAQSVAMAWWWAGRVSDRAVLRAVRAFGGYGVAVEYDVQLYYRRVKAVALLLGDSQSQLDEIALRAFEHKAVALPPAGDVGIDFGLGTAAEAYAQELRRFVEAHMTPEILAKKHYSTSGHHAGFHEQLAAAGYAFPELAAYMGGPERSRYELMAAAAVWEDIGWTRVPSAVTEMVGKLVELWSQPEAKAEILPRFIAGKALGALGFSEPKAGSDVFSTSFSAARDGDGWVLSGQKMFTTNAHNADYIIMLTRTSDTGKRHEGLTMFIMPLHLAGIQIQAVHTLQDERTNIVFFDDVKVADKYRIGEVGGGAKVMASALKIEQGGADYHYAQLAMLRRAVAWATRESADSDRPIARSQVRRALAEAATNCMVGEVLCRRALWGSIEGTYQVYWGPMAKLFTSEALLSDATAIVDMASPHALIRGVDEDLDVVEAMMRRAIAMTIYGGTSEIHRSIIAENALGMPKSRS